MVDDEGDDDGEEMYDDYDDEDDEGTIHPYGPGVDAKQLLTTLTEKEQNQNVKISFSNNAQSPTLARQHPVNLDRKGGPLAPLPGPPRDVTAQIVKPRFVTLNWLEPHKNADEITSYSVYYKLSTSER